MNINEYLQENINYEVLINSYNDDKTIHTKPFGIKIENSIIKLNLYPNKTLKNIKLNTKFIIQFTDNPLTYTKALFNQLTVNNYKNNILKDSSYVIKAKAINIEPQHKTDKYGSNIVNTVTAEVLESLIINNSISTINRATNTIIELLIEYSRLQFREDSYLEIFENRLDQSTKIIEKTGNENHLKSLKLIKENFNMYKQNKIN